MLSVQDIMSSKVITLNETHTMKNAHDLTHAKGIRHLPIVDSKTNRIIAVLSQKDMVARVLSIISEHGADNLVEYEMKTPILDIASDMFEVAHTDQPVDEIAHFFLENKFGCLPILNAKDELSGILTSSDFVRLAIRLMQK